MPPSMLEVRNLVRTFGSHRAVDGLDLQVRSGELVGFVGGNGAGKTTTMRMIMGVLEPDSGELLWNGAPATEAVRRRFGYMPEERGLYPKQQVLAQLVYLGRLQGLDAGAAKVAGQRLLERFGLAERAADKLESLSLGNQQRVQIAAAVIAEPQLLVLDEPFSGLDPGATDSMAALLREHAARGTGVLFSSHQLDLVESVCDRLVVLARGRVVAAGTPAELRRRGPVHHRLVTGSDVGWVRDLRWLQIREAADRTALVVLQTPDQADQLLREALRHGPVYQLSEEVPTLAEIFREIAA